MDTRSSQKTSGYLGPAAVDIERRLSTLVSRTGRTKAFYLREIIDRSLDDVEDYYLAAHVLERIYKGEEQVHTASDVRRELGLGD